CDRASLGWLDGGYIRLLAMSRTEQFDRQMSAAQALEKAMEECLDQDEEILWPAVEGANSVTRNHETFSQEQKSGNVCSIPLRLDGKAVAVLTCERHEGAFNAVELQQMRLICDQAVRRIGGLARAGPRPLANTSPTGWGRNIRGAKCRPSGSCLFLRRCFSCG